MKTYRVLPSGETLRNTFTVADDPAGSSCPAAAAFGPDSLLYVLCLSARVTVYNPATGLRVRTLNAGNPSAVANLAWGIAVDQDGTIAVGVDQYLGEENHAYRVHRMTPMGALVNEIAVPSFASKLACDLSGDLFCLFSEPDYAQDVLRVYRPGGSLELTQVLASPHVLDFTGIATDPMCGVHIAADSASTSSTLRRMISDWDRDGVCDSWELHGLQPGGGYPNWIPPDATPVHKDLYVQIGAMQGFSPNPAAIADVAQALAAAPSDSLAFPNPDNQPGITLHYVFGDTTLTRMLLRPPFWPAFDSLKTLSFVTSGERSQYGPNFFGTKDRVFRFCIFADSLLDGRRIAMAGKAKSIQSRDFIVALGPAEYYRDILVPGGTRNEQASVFMHELGHAVGLRHGGADDNQFKPNYRSVMSYIWHMPSARVERYWRLTYSPRPFNRLVKASVNELQGIGGTSGDSVFITVVLPVSLPDQRVVPEAGPADLNGDGALTTNASCPDLDVPWFNSFPTPVLDPYSDWRLINLSPFENDIDPSDLGEGIFEELSFDEHSLWFPPDGRPACDCNHNGFSDWRDIQSGRSVDTNSNGVPDECERERVRVDRTLVIACPAGDADGLLITGDIGDLCAYDTAMVKTPKFVVAHRAPGSSLVLWGYNGTQADTLISYAGKITEFYVGADRWSGHGSVYFDVYAGSLHLGTTPDIEVRSLDVDSLVVGAVDAFDMQAVVARLGQGGPAWFDFDNNGMIGPEDSTAVADHRNHGGGGPLLAPNGGEMLALGDSILIRWVAGRGDSARVTVRLERDYGPQYETISQDLADAGELAWIVDSPDAPRADYRVRIIRTAGVRLPDDSNVYGYDSSDGRFTISGGTLAVESSVPVAYSFYSGRPNPGQHSVSFRFDLPLQADARFEIFDLQGRRLRRFVATYGPGRHEWMWDLKNDGGRRVGDGVYFCRFTAGSFTAQNKLVVLR